MAVGDSPSANSEDTPYVQLVSPAELDVSEFNERFGDLNIADLVDSVEERGVIEPPLARHENGKLRVIVGQRRTMAALQVGLEEIPVVVVDFYDDIDALIASVTENYEGFREEVQPSDRARAINQLREMTGWTYSRIDDELGLGEGTAARWHERSRSEWEGTELSPEQDDSEDNETSVTPDSGSDDLSPQTENPVEGLTDGVLREIRRMTGGGSEGEELARKVAEAGLHEKDVKQVKKAVERGQGPEEAIKQIREDKQADLGSKIQIQMTIGGEVGTAVQSYAEENHMTEQQVIRDAIMDYLKRQGAL